MVPLQSEVAEGLFLFAKSIYMLNEKVIARIDLCQCNTSEYKEKMSKNE
jgi:hypothetical protein